MRQVSVKEIENILAKEFETINIELAKDVEQAFANSLKKESSQTGKSTLEKLQKNAEIAKEDHIPLCQDTGTAIVYLELGQEIELIDGDLQEAIEKGVGQGYEMLRKSIVSDPLERKNTQDNCPPQVHTKIVSGDKLTIKIMAKGGGAENKSVLKMLNPADGIEGIKEVVLETVRNAGASACPPLTVGVGLGGTFDSVAGLAKRSLFREIGSNHADKKYQTLEDELLKEINKLGIGPAGFGGDTTALAVFIETAPCHIASLPVAVNIQCHAARHKEIEN